MPKLGLLERLNNNGVIVGDGGCMFVLEKLGYVQAGKWTPEAVVESPHVVKRIHKEFIRAGSDVCQTFTFNCWKLNEANQTITPENALEAGCVVAKEAAGEKCLVGGSISGSINFNKKRSKENLELEIKFHCDIFVKHAVDFIIIEVVQLIDEMEIAIAECKKTSLPIVACMSIGPEGDVSGVKTAECAIRMAKAGADVLGANCRFGPVKNLETTKIMKDALKKANLNVPLIAQPMGYNTPDVGPLGLSAQPEYPLALEPRLMTRFEVERWAREAYLLGVRYIGGCCGFEPYHIRAIAEELAKERGLLPEPTKKHGAWSSALSRSRKSKPWLIERSDKTYWDFLVPATGRPKSPAFTDPNPGSEEILRKYKTKFSPMKVPQNNAQDLEKPFYDVKGGVGQTATNITKPTQGITVEDPTKSALEAPIEKTRKEGEHTESSNLNKAKERSMKKAENLNADNVEKDKDRGTKEAGTKEPPVEKAPGEGKKMENSKPDKAKERTMKEAENIKADNVNKEKDRGQKKADTKEPPIEKASEESKNIQSSNLDKSKERSMKKADNINADIVDKDKNRGTKEAVTKEPLTEKTSGESKHIEGISVDKNKQRSMKKTENIKADNIDKEKDRGAKEAGSKEAPIEKSREDSKDIEGFNVDKNKQRSMKKAENINADKIDKEKDGGAKEAGTKEAPVEKAPGEGKHMEGSNVDKAKEHPIKERGSVKQKGVVDPEVQKDAIKPGQETSDVPQGKGMSIKLTYSKT